MVKINLFKPISEEDSAFMLASWLPRGRIWESSFDDQTNIGKLIAGLAIEYYRLGLKTNEIATEMNLDHTLSLLEEWERSVGIPGNCLYVSGNTFEERRRNIKLLFSNFQGVQTAEDFERVALLFGFNVDVQPGVDVGGFPIPFPLHFFESSKVMKFTIYVRKTGSPVSESYFPLPFPIPFTGGGNTFLQCIFDLLAPANVEVFIEN